MRVSDTKERGKIMEEAKAFIDTVFEKWGAGLFNGPDAYV